MVVCSAIGSEAIILGCTHRVYEEPMFGDGFCIEEELRAGKCLLKEVCREERDPLEDRETGARLEDKHGNSLLGKEADDNGRPAQLSKNAMGALKMHKRTKGCGCGAWRWPRRRTGTRTGRARRSRDRRSRCSAKRISTFFVQVEQFMSTNTGEREPEGRAKDDAEEGEPSHGQADGVRELEERRLHAGNPCGGNGARNDCGGDKPEGDDTA